MAERRFFIIVHERLNDTKTSISLSMKYKIFFEFTKKTNGYEFIGYTKKNGNDKFDYKIQVLKCHNEHIVLFLFIVVSNCVLMFS